MDGTERFSHGVCINCAHLKRLLSIYRFYIVLIVFYDKLIMHRMDKYKCLRTNTIVFVNPRRNEKIVRELIIYWLVVHSLL